MSVKRPNILLITSDQHRGDCFGFEGRAVKTPHLDLLAREGTRRDLRPGLIAALESTTMVPGPAPEQLGA